MSTNRNDFRDIVTSDSKLRETIYDRKFVSEVVMLSRLKLNEPTDLELRKELTHVKKTYKMGDKLSKFSFDSYGSPDYWWIIAWYNNKPTDGHFKLGDVVYIPHPLDKAINIATRER